MCDVVLPEPVVATISRLNPRRLAILLACIRLGRKFTAKDVRKAMPSAEPSLPRDLHALEEGGLLHADPPHTVARQGRPVTYTVAQQTRTVFSELAQLVDDAYTTTDTTAGPSVT
ncbi:hypothetical protein GZ998_08920 [Actinomyces sp. 594]|uniref:hypothetical protein n=1 Tax=Actinomyces sp. 594 TaxID=2057793 RepID=UPI001C56D9EA|nr:hypothetical protein [Actinomyces sp. 594]MBW3069621.1 hypothetical protein [Actinomyces sp. 594]